MSIFQSLPCHGLQIVVSGLGQRNVKEDQGEQSDEKSHSEVAPLHPKQILVIQAREERAVRNERRDDTSNALDPLGKVESRLRKLAWTGQGNVRIRRDLQTREAEGDDEVRDEETGVRSEDRRRPESHRTHGIDTEAGDKGGFEPLVLEDPVANKEGPEEVGGPVCGVQCDDLPCRVPQKRLNLSIEGVDDASGKPPHEEEG
jgi:hypothetical protein